MLSHTSTGEWQSFEVRMRRRRAERLILRAEGALESGSVEDARLCLSEARSLAPDLPALDAIEQRLSSTADRSVPHRSRTALAVAAAAVLIAATAIGGWPLISRSGTAMDTVSGQTPAPLAAAAPDPVRPAPPDPVPASAPASAAASIVTSGVTTTPAIEAAVSETAVPEPAAPAAPAAASDPEASRPRVPFVDPLPLPEHTLGRVTVPAVPPSTPSTPVGGLALPAASDAPPPVPPAPPSEEPAVRSVLDRYASAYSTLDVAAAQQVWPGVNRVALSRAFDNLASQEVALGNCRIDVAASSATARCVGTTSWAPKVGDGGRHSESRQWTFELTRAASGWQIVSARVQNR